MSFRNILLEFLRCKKLLDHEIREEEAIFICFVIRKPFDYLQPYHNLSCCWRSIVSVWVSTWPFMINDVNIIASANNLFFLNDPKCSFFPWLHSMPILTDLLQQIQFLPCFLIQFITIMKEVSHILNISISLNLQFYWYSYKNFDNPTIEGIYGIMIRFYYSINLRHLLNGILPYQYDISQPQKIFAVHFLLASLK